MQLSCPDYTWPLLPHPAALDLVGALEFDAIDIGFMGNRSHVRPESLSGQARPVGEELRRGLEQRGLAVADVFAIPWTDFETAAVNNPAPAQRARSESFFALAVEFALAVGAPGITTLPGVLFAGDTQQAALERSGQALSRRLEQAARAGLSLSVEPHVQSLIDTPDKTRELLDLVPGLQLTLDHGHFAYGGTPQSQIDALLPAARHLQCRAARPGVLQATLAEGAIDYTSVVDHLLEQGYEGRLAVEYVWSDWLECDRVDTVAETALLRDLLRGALDRQVCAGSAAPAPPAGERA